MASSGRGHRHRPGSVQWLNQLWYGPAMRATPWWRRRTVVIVAGCLIAIVTFGTRTSFGLFTEPLSVLRGWDREAFALAIAVQNLLWGVGQPFAGAIADRYGAGRVLAAGGAVYALGTALMAVSSSPATLALTGGVLVGLGLSGGSFTIVIAAFARLVPAGRPSPTRSRPASRPRRRCAARWRIPAMSCSPAASSSAASTSRSSRPTCRRT